MCRGKEAGQRLSKRGQRRDVLPENETALRLEAKHKQLVALSFRDIKLLFIDP